MDELLVHGGIAMAVGARRTEILGVAMRQLREKARDRQLSDQDIEVLLNTIEVLARDLITEG